MNLFGWFSAKPKVVDDIFDKDEGLLVKAGSWFGGLQFTDQEQAEHSLKVADKVVEYIGSTLSEKTERSVTRRSIAVLWIYIQLFLILVTAISIPWNIAVAKEFFSLATCDVMLWGSGSIIVFFFGPYVWGTYIKRGVNGEPPKK